MTNLVLDIGNTATKLVIFQNGEVVRQFSGKEIHAPKLTDVFDGFKVDGIMMSCVGKPSDEVQEMLAKAPCPVRQLTAGTILPLKNAYKTPQTLGPDRLAAAVGAWTLFPNHDILVVDAGTCITYDVIDRNGIYLGGNIAPGIQMRLKAMNDYSQKLPLLEVPEEWPSSMGSTTEEAMKAGVMWGIKAEIENYARLWLGEKGKAQVVMTGGNALLLSEKIEIKQLCVDPLLVARGLNYILENDEN